MNTSVLSAPPQPPAGAPVRFLHPGEVALAHRGERLETLLGSCVSVLLTDPQHTVGAMCHIVHASQRGKTPDLHDTCQAAPAMKALFALLRCSGFAPELCDAWVVGGGNMFPGQASIYPVGHANLDWVYQFLHREGIPVIGESVGGPCYRKIGWTIGAAAPEITISCVDAVAGGIDQ